jgi:hypothetical protein
MCVKPNKTLINTPMEEKVLWIADPNISASPPWSPDDLIEYMELLAQDPNYIYYLHPYQSLNHLHIHRFQRSSWQVGNYKLSPMDLKQIGQLIADSKRLGLSQAYALDLGFPMYNYNVVVCALSIAVYLWGISISGADKIRTVYCSKEMVETLLSSFEKTSLCTRLIEGITHGKVIVPRGRIPVLKSGMIDLFFFFETDSENLLSEFRGTQKFIDIGQIDAESHISLSPFNFFDTDVPLNLLLVSKERSMKTVIIKLKDNEMAVDPKSVQKPYHRLGTRVKRRNISKGEGLLSGLQLLGCALDLGCGNCGFTEVLEKRGIRVEGVTLFLDSENKSYLGRNIIFHDLLSGTKAPITVTPTLVIIDLSDSRGVTSFRKYAEKMDSLIDEYVPDAAMVIFKWKGVYEYSEALKRAVRNLKDLEMVKPEGSRAGNSEIYFRGIRDSQSFNWYTSIHNEWGKLVSVMNDWNADEPELLSRYYGRYNCPRDIRDLQNTWTNQPIVFRSLTPEVHLSEWRTLGPCRLMKDAMSYIISCVPTYGTWEMMASGVCFKGDPVVINLDALEVITEPLVFDVRQPVKFVIDDPNTISTVIKISFPSSKYGKILDVGGGKSNFYHRWISSPVTILDPEGDAEGIFRTTFQNFLLQPGSYDFDTIISFQSTLAWENVDMALVRKKFPNVTRILVTLLEDRPLGYVMINDTHFKTNGFEDVIIETGLSSKDPSPLMIVYAQHKGYPFDSVVLNTKWGVYDLSKAQGVLRAKSFKASNSSVPFQLNTTLGNPPSVSTSSSKSDTSDGDTLDDLYQSDSESKKLDVSSMTKTNDGSALDSTNINDGKGATSDSMSRPKMEVDKGSDSESEIINKLVKNDSNVRDDESGSDSEDDDTMLEKDLLILELKTRIKDLMISNQFLTQRNQMLEKELEVFKEQATSMKNLIVDRKKSKKK